MIYVYAKYQKPTPYIKRDIANVKVFTTPAGRTAGRNRHYIDSHCIACESMMVDTAASVNVIDICTYTKISEPALQKADVELYPYGRMLHYQPASSQNQHITYNKRGLPTSATQKQPGVSSDPSI